MHSERTVNTYKTVPRTSGNMEKWASYCCVVHCLLWYNWFVYISAMAEQINM